MEQACAHRTAELQRRHHTRHAVERGHKWGIENGASSLPTIEAVVSVRELGDAAKLEAKKNQAFHAQGCSDSEGTNGLVLGE